MDSTVDVLTGTGHPTVTYLHFKHWEYESPSAAQSSFIDEERKQHLSVGIKTHICNTARNSMPVGKYRHRSSPLGSMAPPDLMSNYIGKIGHISFHLKIKDLSVKFELLKFLD